MDEKDRRRLDNQRLYSIKINEFFCANFNFNSLKKKVPFGIVVVGAAAAAISSYFR